MKAAPVFASSAGNPSTALAQLAGVCLATWLLIGRWSPARLMPLPGFESGAWLELRHLLAVVLAFLTFIVLLSVRGSIRRSSLGPIAWFSMLGMYLIATVIWSPDPGLALKKVADLIAIGVVAMVAWVWSRLPSALAFRKALWTGLTGICALLMFSAAASVSGTTRLAALGGGPNVFARNMGLAAIAGLQLVPRRKVAGMVLLSVGVSLALLSGSRGGMLALLFGVVALMSLSLEHRRAPNLLFLTAGAFVAAIAMSYTAFGQTAALVFNNRVLKLTLLEQHSAGRESLYGQAIALWRESPVFGHGLGGWQSITGINYPHNLFLELACDGGAVAVLLFAIALGAIGRVIWQSRAAVDHASAAAFVLFLVASQFSGTLYDARAVFIFGLLAATPLTVARTATAQASLSAARSRSQPLVPRKGVAACA